MENKFNPREIRLVIGLGNPGKAYEKTHHNAGRMFAEALAEYHRKNLKRSLRGGFAYAEIGKWTLIVPRTFMNESGKAALRALKAFRARPEETLVVHDENDLPLGEYKLDFGRGDAGHKGVASVTEAIGKNFRRLRIGIQPAGGGRKKAEDFVLRRLSPEDETEMEMLFNEVIGLYFRSEN